MQDPTFVQKAFSTIAKRYVLTNHLLSGGTDILWRRKVARLVATWKPALLLDIATGSGDLAAAIRQKFPATTLIGADFCAPMLEYARKRNLPNLLVADGLALPFVDETFDAVTVAFGLRNMADWRLALREMARVTKPDGHLLVLDFSQPQFPPFRIPYRFYLNRVLPRIAGLLTGSTESYQYLSDSIGEFPHGQAMNRLISANGFTETTCEPLTFGVASIYVARKPRP